MYLNHYKILKKEEKNLLMVPYSYSYWCEVLFEKACRIFEWDGFEDYFPQHEIEMRLIKDGYCAFTDDKKCGYMIASGGMSGPTEYWDQFKNFTYSAPTAQGGTKRIGRECVIINNTALRNPLFPLIARYASLLAHAEVSLKCALVNMRYTDTFRAEDQSTAESVRKWHEKLYEGASDVIVDESMIEAITSIANTKSGGLGVAEALEARNELLRSFYNEIGVRYAREKKERMLTDEVSSDQQMLLLNINDMLRQRQKAAKEINEVYGLNITVKLSPEFEMISNDPEIEGGEEDEDQKVPEE